MTELHTVELDAEAELAALEAAAVEAAAADVELEREAAAVGHDPGQWRQAAAWLVAIVDAKVCPNWHLQPEDHDELADKTALVLDHYFPGGVDGVDTWHPLWQLTFAFGAVALTRGFDFERLAFRPLHPPRTDDDGASETSGRNELLPDGDDAERQVGAGFAIGGGG